MARPVTQCNLVASLLAASFLLAPEVAAQSTNALVAHGTKFRGISVNQSIHEVETAMASNGFKSEVVDDPVRVLGQDAKGNKCATVHFKNRRSIMLEFAPCYFRLDSRISARDFAQAMVTNFPIQKMEFGSRQEVDMVAYPAQRYRVSYYSGHLKTGEYMEIIVNDGPFITRENYQGSSPKVTVAIGEGTGAPIFK